MFEISAALASRTITSVSIIIGPRFDAGVMIFPVHGALQEWVFDCTWPHNALPVKSHSPFGRAHFDADAGPWARLYPIGLLLPQNAVGIDQRRAPRWYICAEHRRPGQRGRNQGQQREVK